MSDDLIAIIACCILGMMAHGASRQPWLEWVLRVTYGLFIVGEAINIMADPLSTSEQPWNYGVLVGSTAVSTVLLFKPGRQLISLILTFINQLVSFRFVLAAFGKLEEAVPAAAPRLTPQFVAQAKEPEIAGESVLKPAEAPAETTDASEAKAEAKVEEQAKAEPGAEAAANAELDSSEDAKVDPNAKVDPDAKADPDAKTDSDTKADATEAEPSAELKATAAAREDEPVPAPAVPLVMKKVGFFQSFFAERIFIAESIPHMNALWIYVTCLAFLLTHMEIAGFQMPSIMVPIPVTMDQLFSYNFLGLVMLAICGTGIFISRSPLEVLKRLGLVKPKWQHVVIGFVGIFITFAYDYFWSTYTHAQEGLGYADKLTHYNEGTFTSGSAPGPALFVASATGLCAGLGEEILIRGALQPCLGIIPAAFMHGVLHGQFSHAPLLILQVFGWSAIMSVIRRYTNTTTTIITHVGFNFLSTFLIAFNP